jgi:hypothetical protein
MPSKRSQPATNRAAFTSNAANRLPARKGSPAVRKIVGDATKRPKAYVDRVIVSEAGE